jgi:hypothetical protein
VRQFATKHLNKLAQTKLAEHGFHQYYAIGVIQVSVERSPLTNRPWHEQPDLSPLELPKETSFGVNRD